MNDREVDHGVRVDWRFAGQIIRDPIILAEDLAEMGFPDSNVASRCNRYAMFRGRKPGRGAVLMAKRDFDAIPHPQRCQHSLAITCENTVVIRRLCVTRVEVLAPNILQNAKKEPIGVTPESPCIVEIADARHYAPMTSIMRSFNWRNVMGRPRTGALNYQLICEAIWFEGLMGLFQLPLEFAIDDPLDLIRLPEQLGFQGMNAWEALWIVLDLAGWSFTLTHDGLPRIFSPKLVSETQDVFDNIQRKIIGRRSRYDTLAEPVHTALPEKIRAVTRQRDYQWYQDPNAESFHSGDMVDRFPMFEFEFDSKELLRELPLNADDAGQQINQELINTKEFVPGTKQVVYGTVPYLTNDRAVAVNADVVLADLRFVATRYLRRLARIDQGSTWIYSLLWPFWPNSHVSAVGYTDVGGAFTMTVKIGDDEAIEWQGNELSFNAELARPGNPGWRDPVPYGRELYGVLVDHFGITPDNGGSPGEDDSPGLDDTARGTVRKRGEAEGEPDDTASGVRPPLPDRFLGMVSILSGHLATEQIGGPSAADRREQPTVRWVHRDFVPAYNGTGRPIRMNRRVYGKWNYQLGVSGAWVIVATGADPSPEGADWAMECLLGGQERSFIQDPGKIVLDKRRMLKLIVPEDVKDEDNPDKIGISFFNGPDCSVLATRDSKDELCPILWDDSPCLINLSVKCWIKFNELVPEERADLPPPFPPGGVQAAAALAGINPHVTWLGPSRLSSLRMRLPPAPHRSHKFLISGPSQGSDTELMWAGPGYSGYMEVKLLDDTPVGLTFEYGLLVASTYPVMQAAPKVYGVDFKDCPPTRFNPCDPCKFPEDSPGEEDENGELPDRGPHCEICFPNTGWRPGDTVRFTIDGFPRPGYEPPWPWPSRRTEDRPYYRELVEFINGEHIWRANDLNFHDGCSVGGTGIIGVSTTTGNFVLNVGPVLSFVGNDVWELWMSFTQGVFPAADYRLRIEPFNCMGTRIWVVDQPNHEAGPVKFQITWHGVNN